MMSKEEKSKDSVFSQPVRRMKAEDIDRVSGGSGPYTEMSGIKADGWPDNQSKNQTG